MTPEQLAHLALSLRDNEAFQTAMNTIRARAVDALCACDATDADAIRQHQATVRVVDDLRNGLTHMALAAKPPKPPGIA